MCLAHSEFLLFQNNHSLFVRFLFKTYQDVSSQMQPGVWVKVLCNKEGGIFSYWHHGIVTEMANNNPSKIIHFCSEEQTDGEKAIRETSVNWFLHEGRDAQIVDDDSNFSMQEVVHRARKQLGKKNYDLAKKNCEHFASYCYKGQPFSEQVLWGGGAIVFTLAAIACGIVYQNASNSWN